MLNTQKFALTKYILKVWLFSVQHKMSDIRKRARVDGLDEEPMLKRARSMSKSRTRLPAAVGKSESRGRSTTRSLSRTPRDKSGMRDETVSSKFSLFWSLFHSTFLLELMSLILTIKFLRYFKVN